jgi:hypothetical protein
MTVYTELGGERRGGGSQLLIITGSSQRLQNKVETTQVHTSPHWSGSWKALVVRFDRLHPMPAPSAV